MEDADPSDDFLLEITVDGRTYKIRALDFSAEDDLAIFQKTGVTLAEIIAGRITLFTVAAILWRYRFHLEGPMIQFEQVAKELKMRDLETISFEESSKGDVGPNP